MNKRTALLLTFTVFICCTPLARAQDTKDYQELLTQQEHFNKRKDYREYDSLLAPDFTMVAPDGSVITRTQALTHYKEYTSRKDMPIRQASAKKIDSVAIQGKEGVVLISSTSAYKEKDPLGTFGPKDQEHEWNSIQINHFTWTRTPRGWKLKSLANVAIKRWIDGRPYPATEESSDASPKSPEPPKP